MIAFNEVSKGCIRVLNDEAVIGWLVQPNGQTDYKFAYQEGAALAMNELSAITNKFKELREEDCDD